MQVMGFTEIDLPLGYDNSLSFYSDNYAVFDLRPANVVRMPAGLTVPVDCFVERISSQQVDILATYR